VGSRDIGGRPSDTGHFGEATTPRAELGVSVICPCRNEAGNVPSVVERLPTLGSATELVFVEGGSTDGTRIEIERQISLHPRRDIRLLFQPSSGKADAVRTGFAAAKHDIVMVLDADLTVAPEELPRFYRALLNGQADVVNGSRLIEPMEPGAMRPLNKLANRAFPLVFRAITGVDITDMLCGTKALRRRDYDALASQRRHYGNLDPFGDFELLFSAAQAQMRIVDVPVRYRARRYGRTNISRFRDGWRLLRVCLRAARAR
jgi:glycosyltransferase involved in cell wall biosynthesis